MGYFRFFGVGRFAKMSSMKDFMIDFCLGGVAGAVAKTVTAPIERIKLVIQTQDANPKIRSGEVPRYTGIVDCGSRIIKEQGARRFWDGNFTNCIRYFPTQAFNLAFKNTFSGLFDCMQKTAAGPGGFMALYTGFGVSVVGIVGYRGLQLGTFDTITGLNPYKKDKGIMS